MDAVELLHGLVTIPSPSGEEAEAVNWLVGQMRELGFQAYVDEAGNAVGVLGEGPRQIVLLGHIDTVPGGPRPEFRDGRLYGRGAVDAKASVAAMAAAAARLAAAGGPARGELLLLATFCEETRETTMPALLEEIGLPEAALVGEPTSLRPCVAQRGLMILSLRWTGEQVHAGWAADLPQKPPNAIERAARDLLRLSEIRFERRHPLLGGISLTPTMIEGGIARNLTPPECRCVVDVRTTPAWAHEEIARKVSDVLEGEVKVLSDRLRPVETPPGSRLLEAVRKVLPGAEPFGSPTASDWVWLGKTDALKLGPGDSRLSHTKDENISVEEVAKAEEIFFRIAREYLS